jgi:hypothetical protein
MKILKSIKKPEFLWYNTLINKLTINSVDTANIISVIVFDEISVLKHVIKLVITEYENFNIYKSIQYYKNE